MKTPEIANDREEVKREFRAECTVIIDQGILDTLLGFIQPRSTIPIDVALAHVQRIRQPIELALRGKMIHPSAIPRLRRKMEEKYHGAQIPAGSSVGIELAQSLGACQSQNVLNSFHSSGLNKDNPNTFFAQILNATKLRTTWTRIFFKDRPKTVQEAREIALSSLAGVDVKSLTTRVSFEYGIRNVASTTAAGAGAESGNPVEDWHAVHCALVGRTDDVLAGYTGGRITISLSAQKMFENRLLPRAICRAIENHFTDVVCVPATLSARQINIYVPYPADAITAEMQKKFLECTCWKQSVAQVNVCGVRGSGDVVFAEENGECSASLTNGSFRGILNVPAVDHTRTTTNNMWDVYHAFGIEATRTFLIREVSTKVVPNVNKCHVTLLADRMTFSGIKSISRYSMRTDADGTNASVLSCATFEESIEHFINGGVHSRTEPTTSVSASIVCGKRSGTGTGSIDVLVDTKKLSMTADVLRKSIQDYGMVNTADRAVRPHFNDNMYG